MGSNHSKLGKPKPAKLTKSELAKIKGILKEYQVLPVTQNHDIYLKWAEKLESGKYVQGNALLRSKDNTFCCLGVLCDLYHQLTGNGKWNGLNDLHKNNTFLGESAILPSAVGSWCIPNHKQDGNIALQNKETGNVRGFAFLNDVDKLNFKQIAWIIREAVRLGKGS